MTVADERVAERTFLGHPRGLFVLFFTELWERFSFYAARAILVLYIVAPVSKGGLGWTDQRGLLVLGVYQFLVYLFGVPGGMVADRFLGSRKAVLWGTILICIGNSVLVAPPAWALLLGLAVVALGSGLLKPNISSMVGQLYADGDVRRDSAFTIFYMGINIGSFLSGITSGMIVMYFGWRWGFAAPAFGMLIGILIFVIGGKCLGNVGRHPRAVACAATMGGASAPAKVPLTSQERRRLVVMFVSFVVVVVFWAAFEQSAGMLNIFADRFTDRTVFGFQMPATWFQSVNPFFVITLAPFAAALWAWLGRKGRNPSAIFKMGLGTIVQGIGFVFMVIAFTRCQQAETGLCSPLWLALTYFCCTLGELLLSPVALSFITSNAPKRMVSSMMGIYFAVTGFGCFLASQIGTYSMVLGMLNVFVLVAAVSVAVGTMLVVFTKAINRYGE